MMDKITKYQPIIIVSVLLLILVGPMFGPIPKYLRDTLNLNIRSTSGWLLVGFFISLSIIVSVVFVYFKKSEGRFIIYIYTPLRGIYIYYITTIQHRSRY